MEVRTSNFARFDAVKPIEQNHRRLYLLLYRRFVRQFAVGGSFLLLISTDAISASFRWASSSNRIYIEGGGVATLSDIKGALPKAPLDLVDPVNKIWILRVNLVVDDGSLLVLHGTSEEGGDVNELRLLSNNSSAPGSFVSVTADYGVLDIRATTITSWDTAAGEPDLEFATYGRAFVRVRSRLAADGVTPLASRMDVVLSEICYLGYNAAESYGLAWKVIGSQPDILDRVRVHGEIRHSRIHDNYFGVYTYVAQDCLWLNNEVFSNVQHGLVPHSDSDNALIENNDVHHNGNHGIIASERCVGLVIRNNTFRSNVGNGIMLHRSSDDGLVEGNECSLNGDSGIAIVASLGTTIRDNVCLSNAHAGIRLSVGAGHCTVEGNEIGYSGKYGLYFYQGNDSPQPGDDGRPKHNRLASNLVHDCVGEGLKLTDGDDNWFTGNTFVANGSKMRFTTSTLTLFTSNSIPKDVTVKLTGSSSVANFVYFSGQPFVKLEMDRYSSGSYFEDYRNAIFDVPEDAYTTVSGVPPNASSAFSLHYSQLGSSTTVVTRNLFAYVDIGIVWVKPTVWKLTGNMAKSWRAHAQTDSPIEYVVGDLNPGADYEVLEDSASYGVITANAEGRIGFWVDPALWSPPYRTNKMTYSIVPR